MSKLKLRDIAKSQTGPFGSQLHEEDYVSFGTPIVTVEHLGETSFTYQNLPFVSDKDRDRLKKYLLFEGDIVFSRVGSVDRNTYVSRKEDGWLFSGRCIRVRVDKEKADSKFLSFYFRQKYFKEMMLNISVGATMPSLNTTLMDNIPLNIPEITIQQRIAAVLSALDDKIELNNQINAELEAMAKTLYDYWFVQFDFPVVSTGSTTGDSDAELVEATGVASGASAPKGYKSSGGKMVYNEVLKREIPERWKVKKLESLLSEFTKGITTSYVEKSNIINLNQKVNKGFRLERQYFKYLNENVEIPISKFAKQKDILINSLGQGTLGRIHFFRDKVENIVIDQHLFILRAETKLISPSYLFNTLDSASYKLQIERQITGSTGMQMLNASNLKDLNIIVPTIQICNQFERTTISIYQKISINDQQNQELAQLRDWLLPMLMNGQVTVGDVEENLSMVAEGQSTYSKNNIQ